MPHLIEVLSILLSPINNRAFTPCGEHQSSSTMHGDAPVAYIAQVVRNYETFHCFLKLADEAQLCVVDITESKRPHNLLPYMLSYDRLSVRLFRVSSSRINASWGNHTLLTAYITLFFMHSQFFPTRMINIFCATWKWHACLIQLFCNKKQLYPTIKIMPVSTCDFNRSRFFS